MESVPVGDRSLRFQERQAVRIDLPGGAVSRNGPRADGALSQAHRSHEAHQGPEKPTKVFLGLECGHVVLLFGRHKHHGRRGALLWMEAEAQHKRVVAEWSAGVGAHR